MVHNREGFEKSRITEKEIAEALPHHRCASARCAEQPIAHLDWGGVLDGGYSRKAGVQWRLPPKRPKPWSTQSLIG